MITVIVYINYIIYKRAGACCAYDNNVIRRTTRVPMYTRLAAAAGEDL